MKLDSLFYKLVLVCILLVSICVISGCGSDESVSDSTASVAQNTPQMTESVNETDFEDSTINQNHESPNVPTSSPTQGPLSTEEIVITLPDDEV